MSDIDKYCYILSDIDIYCWILSDIDCIFSHILPDIARNCQIFLDIGNTQPLQCVLQFLQLTVQFSSVRSLYETEIFLFLSGAAFPLSPDAATASFPLLKLYLEKLAPTFCFPSFCKFDLFDLHCIGTFQILKYISQQIFTERGGGIYPKKGTCFVTTLSGCSLAIDCFLSVSFFLLSALANSTLNS